MRRLLILFTVLMTTACEQKNKTAMETETKSKVGTLEIVIFRTKEGVDQDAFKKAAEAVNPVVEKFDGYLGRKLAVDPDGNWADVVYWKDLEAAEHAAREVLKSETCQKFFGMIDEGSMKFMHLTPAMEHRKPL